jgi:hypothetical protein
MQDMPVFVDGRRAAMNPLFPMSVFRMEVSKRLQTPADRVRLWHVTKDNEQLVDLLRTAAEQQIGPGATLQAELALPDGSFGRREQPLSQSTEDRFAEQSRKVMAHDPPPMRTVFPVSSAPVASPSPPPPKPSKPMSEAEQLEKAMAISLQSQSSALEKEEGLIMALASRGKKMRTMRDDGSCLFRALADQLHVNGVPELRKAVPEHRELREAIVRHMAANPAVYEPFCPFDYDAYLATMSVEGEYGTHLEIQAFCNLFNLQVLVFSDQSPEFPPTVVGEENDDSPPLEVAFLRDNHYNSVVPLDVPELPEAPGIRRGGAECVVCGARVDDPDLHMALAHSEMF